jgi:hypothetical protein
VVQAPNDKQQIAPMVEKTAALPEQLGRIETLLADNGYFSEANGSVSNPMTRRPGAIRCHSSSA